MNNNWLSQRFKDGIKKKLDDNPFSMLGQIVYEGLYHEILEGRLTVNDRIVELQLAKALDTSRTPIKAALNRLVDQGLMERVEGKVYRVKKITFQECLWLYESRIVIEGEAAYLAARRVKEAELKYLAELVVKFHEIDKMNDVDEYERQDKFVTLDREFHNCIMEASRNPYLIEMYKSIECPLQRYRYQTLQLAYDDMMDKNGLERGGSHHGAIYRALKNHLGIVARDEIQSDIKRMYGTMYMLKFV